MMSTPDQKPFDPHETDPGSEVDPNATEEEGVILPKEKDQIGVGLEGLPGGPLYIGTRKGVQGTIIPGPTGAPREIKINANDVAGMELFALTTNAGRRALLVQKLADYRTREKDLQTIYQTAVMEDLVEDGNVVPAKLARELLYDKPDANPYLLQKVIDHIEGYNSGKIPISF
ncbi:hypothetical protein HYZ99_00360 [Candidatus Peregrinibacteria bacterium]|nr:hypothetical protein [Candidatus Peregrinibacteria bacterium]